MSEENKEIESGGNACAKHQRMVGQSVNKALMAGFVRFSVQ